MRPRSFLLLLAGFALALMAAGEADAKEPEWSYTTSDPVRSVAISADGEYIAVGSEDDNVYLFDKDSSTPLWNYTTGEIAYSVAISADGQYIAAGSV
ncbi:MAG: PQQ-binding-like beta-propeller repeat protein, partial [Candidatus Poseidoniia archaeon]|nr:PQQ-binding-like beta-propeller repeat protein [Candidatus Poseidoniia archaeon]